MIWFVVIALVAVGAFIAAYAPYQTVRDARDLRLRADGTVSEARERREAEHRKRMLKSVVALPLLITLGVAGGMVALDAYLPFSPVADVFGPVSSETATVSEELIRSFEEELEAQRREEQLALPDTSGLDLPESQSSFEFFTTHWPLRIVFLFVLAILLMRMHRRVMNARRAYDAGVADRRREYRKIDLKKMREASAA
jgi:hypothetical protein